MNTHLGERLVVSSSLPTDALADNAGDAVGSAPATATPQPPPPSLPLQLPSPLAPHRATTTATASSHPYSALHTLSAYAAVAAAARDVPTHEPPV